MTEAEIQAATAFITHPALRAHAAHRLAVGVTFICPFCENIADTEAGCIPCDDAKFEALAAEYDAQEADRDWFEHAAAYASIYPGDDYEDEQEPIPHLELTLAEFDRAEELRNFFGSDNDI